MGGYLIKENTAVGKPPNGQYAKHISREIIAALSDRQRFGYHAIFEEMTGTNHELAVRISVSTARQTIWIPERLWRRRGGVRNVLADQLSI
jgi:hypothetical protein